MAGRPQFRDPTRLFAAIAEPVYFIDSQRRLAFVNQACATLTGREAGELLGVECRYHSDPSVTGVDAQAALLAPPPEAFDVPAFQTEMTWPAIGSGLPRKFLADCTRLTLAAGQPAGLLVILRSPESASQPQGQDATLAALLHDRLRHYGPALARQYDADRLLGDSPAMEQVRQQVLLASRGEANVLIVGPAGSGRAHVARAIHYHRMGNVPGAQHAGTLVPLDCGSLSAELLSSTLRTLTLGDARRTAAPSTVLLSDVERLPAESQIELAALLARKPALRLLSTAQSRLVDLVRESRFRADLACQLATLEIVLPRLATRSIDIPVLAQMLLEEANAGNAKQLSGFTPEAMDLLVGYPWPGEVGELADLVRHAHAKSPGPQVRPADLPERIQLAREAALYPPKRDEGISLEDFLAKIEKELIAQALSRSRGQKAKAARLLGLPRNKLLRRMAQLGFEMEAEERETAGEMTEIEFEPDDSAG